MADADDMCADQTVIVKNLLSECSTVSFFALGLPEKGGRNADLSEVTASPAYQKRVLEGGAEDWKNGTD